MTSITTYLRAALAILLGERCVVCGRPMVGQGVCPQCLLEFPFINIRGVAGNCIERLFWGQLPVERASATIAYQPGYKVDRLVHAIKYRNRPDLAVAMGRMMAQEHLAAEFFEGIDALLPVPLHPHRERERGYNQSERLAWGISEVTGLPIVNLVHRVVDNVSQTQLSHSERRQNVDHIFEADAKAIAQFLSAENALRSVNNPLRHDGHNSRQDSTPSRPLHILIIDDVITTGSTTISCAQALVEKMPDLRLSFLSFAYAGKRNVGRLFPSDLHLPDCTIDNTDFRERQYRPLA